MPNTDMEITDRTIEKLVSEHSLLQGECMELLMHWQDPGLAEQLAEEALRLRRQVYGDDVYIRGLIEFTNHCRRDCYYCGIRQSNANLTRYRMTNDEVLRCCEEGYALGFRTFVLQGGEDVYLTDERLCELVRAIKERYPDCALTLSVGERDHNSYEKLKQAGADRYLLRHETADAEHYRRLHPQDQTLRMRVNCLLDLKDLGYQVGAGFMVGSPHQKVESLAQDLMFLQALEPEMVGIGPFIPHHDTKFADKPAGSVDFTLFLLSLIRILLPDVLLPVTTAFRTLDPNGWERALHAGANVLMPNITPPEYRGDYTLYDGKKDLGGDAKQNLRVLERSVEEAGFRVVYERGDHRKEPNHVG